MEKKAKLFTNGRSQAVRLPREYRFDGNEVLIRKVGKSVIIEPLEKDEWPRGFWKRFTADSRFETPKPLPARDIDLD